jgi:hypothetical protein
MTLEEIYYVGQTIAVFFLIVSIVFAAWQIRINTKAVRAASRHAVDMSWAENSMGTARDPEMARRWYDIIRNDIKVDDVDPLDLQMMHAHFRAVMFTFQSHYFLWREGSLPREHWEYEREFARRLIRSPLGKHLYAIDLHQRTIREGFREEIEAAPMYGDVELQAPGARAPSPPAGA